ncbi:hypothetical protein MAPG_08801 [Magnaporthiopsis poae ATCC 64411]|uniref:C6 transcription factor n=1 Tax=Magnaporthiopsis poae (strain ATCC 64411 / 73-15) TaxID=644358 RepID=A0A0C4E8A3_MAGP6|nr:hypothetical protein MAPG_08801 [Magnaporthiopsis poae ATCC 64411]
MAEAHQCIRAAEQTIDIVHAIISTDPTGKNNLGVWSWTLYYVFTASLVVSGRLLWALHGESMVDEVAVAHCKALLAKAEKVFSRLDLENSLVQSCLEYTRRISRMCSIKGTAGPPGVSDGRLLAPCSSSLPGLSDGQQQSMSGTAPTGSSTDAADFTTEDMETFRVFSSEMFDPSIFEGFGQSPVEGIPLATTGLWDGF